MENWWKTEDTDTRFSEIINAFATRVLRTLITTDEIRVWSTIQTSAWSSPMITRKFPTLWRKLTSIWLDRHGSVTKDKFKVRYDDSVRQISQTSNKVRYWWQSVSRKSFITTLRQYHQSNYFRDSGDENTFTEIFLNTKIIVTTMTSLVMMMSFPPLSYYTNWSHWQISPSWELVSFQIRPVDLILIPVNIKSFFE